MIQHFELEWYKPFSFLRISNIPRITVIGGKNNSGKTSLLESIFLFCDRHNPDLLLKPLGWRGFQQLHGSEEHLFSHAFHNFDTSRSIRLTASTQHGVQTVSIGYENFGNEVDLFTNYSDDSPSSTRRVTKGLSVSINRHDATGDSATANLKLGNNQISFEDVKGDLSKGAPLARYQGLRVRSSPNEDAERLAELDVKGLAHRATEFAQKFFPEIRSLDALPTGGSSMIYADIGLTRKVPLPAFGDGVARLVSYYLLASEMGPNGILLLDEVGSGLHYTLLQTLWLGLAEITDTFDCQIIATTHSYETLRALQFAHQYLYDKFMYVRLDHDCNSHDTSVVSYTYHELQAAIEHDWEVR